MNFKVRESGSFGNVGSLRNMPSLVSFAPAMSSISILNKAPSIKKLSESRILKSVPSKIAPKPGILKTPSVKLKKRESHVFNVVPEGSSSKIGSGTLIIVPQEKDLQTLKGVGAEYEGSEMFTTSEYSLGPDHERVQDYVPKSDLESFAYSDSMKSEGSSLSVHKLQERESTQTRDWGELSYGEQVKLLRIGPSCPELLEKTRHIIETKEVEQIDPPLESSHLDYALIMNMLEGNWGVDEDQTIAQITFKYIHDESFRRRLAKECHSIIDECECPAHQTITSEKLMNMDDSCYYDIETEEDKIQVVDRLRKEFKEKYEDEMNMDLERLLNPGTDSDENDDYYEEEVKKLAKEVTDEDWLNASKDVSYPECPKFRSEEALLNRPGYPERPEKIKIRRLRMKDFVKAKEKKNIEEVVQSAYNLKINQFRIDDFKGVKWRPRKTYVYRKPNWMKLDPKHDSFIDEQNKEDVK